MPYRIKKVSDKVWKVVTPSQPQGINKTPVATEEPIQKTASSMTKTEYLNVIKGLAILALLFYGAVEILSLINKTPTGPKVECLIISTTVNGHRYEKFAEPGDEYKDLITFGDGTQVSRNAVEFKTETIDANALSNAMRIYSDAQAKVLANPRQ